MSKYRVNLGLHTVFVTEVEADSPQEAQEKAKYMFDENGTKDFTYFDTTDVLFDAWLES
jgi:hypothetical protein